MPVEFRSRKGVAIARVGTWNTSTGTWTCTPEQLQAAVDAQHDPAFRAPVLKLGHTDPRFTDGANLGDGTPAVGRLSNLRLSADRRVLLADLERIPAWLDDILDSAYPSRSIEAELGVQVAGGRQYAMRVTGLALLGETMPAIESLGDIAALYGAEYVAARRIAAAAPAPGETMPRRLGHLVDLPDPQQIAASASLEELTTAAMQWVHGQPEVAMRCHAAPAVARDGMSDGEVQHEHTPDGYGCCVSVSRVLTDAVVFSVWDDDDCALMLYRATYTEADGLFTFGDLERVRAVYEPMSPEMQAQQDGPPSEDATEDPRSPVAAAGAPVTSRDTGRRFPSTGTVNPTDAVPSSRGRDVTAGAHPTGVHVPISPALAKRLGLSEDATDEQVLAALDVLDSARAATTPEGEGGTTTPPPAPTTETVPDVEALVAAAVEKVTTPLLAQIETLSGQVAASNAEKAAEVKARVIAAAVDAGKIEPAAREQWEKDYDESPAVTTRILASLKPGTAVHVAAAGHAGSNDAFTDEDEALFRGLFGGVKGGDV